MDSGGEISLSFKWLLYGRLKIPTEAQVVAAQDQALAVRTVQNHIYGMSVPLNCRVCGIVPEYVDHLLSSCTPLAATMYKQRHDRIASIVHWSLLKHFNLSHVIIGIISLLLLWRALMLNFCGTFIFILNTY